MNKESKYYPYVDEVLSMWHDGDGKTKAEIVNHLRTKYKLTDSYDAVKHGVHSIIREYNYDKELIGENVKLTKQTQKERDKNRIKDKSYREYSRVENAVEEYAKSILEQNKLQSKNLNKLNIKPSKLKSGGIGVIHITDVHSNELIDLPHNKYDFTILSKRLKKHITESLSYFKYKGVGSVLMAFTGDLMNSDRRLDELLSASTNRAKATVLTVHIFKQAILQVAKEYNVKIVSVLGNESRVNKEMTFSNEALSDNYDFTIMGCLKQIFEFSDIKNVSFVSIDKVSEIVDFGSQKWLIAHNLSGSLDNQTKTQSEIGMYSLMGHNIDFIIGGHIHATRITDISSRSASMAGSNSYNENALGLIGRANHNCYVVNGKERYIQVNDIQDVDGIVGYDVVKELEAYNAKSSNKTKSKQVIMSIVI